MVRVLTCADCMAFNVHAWFFEIGENDPSFCIFFEESLRLEHCTQLWFY